ncbi:MAG TPA: site-specific integrase [Anaeromyxobacter sp.]|nr:site-specific integrase [Anaeromyxobacter sp.]
MIPAMPCRIRQLKAAKPIVSFYEETELERLVDAASKTDPRTHVAVLLGGDAGLRFGEILALEWPDVNLLGGLLKVQRAISDDGTPWRSTGTSDRVITDEEGRGLDKWAWLVDVAERRAGLRRGGRVHILRHTFCVRLAARNVPMLTIKELAGHQSIETTMRYMHLSAVAPREGIRALELGTTRAPDEFGSREGSGDR